MSERKTIPQIYTLPNPPLALVLEAPRPATPIIFGRLAPLFLPHDRRLFLADGANCFDPYVFGIEARRRGLGDEVLDRIFITRAFTIHQLAAVTEQMLPPLVASHTPPAIAVLGLDNLFLEESLPSAERARVLRDILTNLKALRGNGARLLITYKRPSSMAAWWKPMLEFGDISARAVEQDNGGWKLQIARCHDGANIADFQYLASEGDRILEGLSPGATG